jgi:hypothetical protein
MKKKIIAVAKKDIKEGEEIVIYLEQKWKSEQIRLYKQGHKFLYHLIKSKVKKYLKKR